MNDIVIDVCHDEVRVAVLEENDLVEIYLEKKDNKRILGNIYKGRVVNVLPGMQAAFVDIGLEKNAFLYVKDAIPKEILENDEIDIKGININNVVKKGQEIIVQVTKEPYAAKGARVTTHITLPGRNLVIMPYSNHIGISRKIIDENERERLKNIIEEINEDKFGIILRTASKDKDKRDFIDDLNFLKGIYRKLEIEKKLGKAPRILFKDLDLIHRSIRDLFTKETNQLLVNDQETYKSIIEFVKIISPSLIDKVKLFKNEVEIFEYFGIEKKISRALERKVWLKSGGYIIIDETEALTSIDVNTGKYVGSVNLEDTVFKTNLEAAKEIAKQLRLRNIGGIIIIDFIDMNKEKDINLVINCLETELKKDRVRTTVLGMTKLGLVEMTRKKNRKKLSSQVLKKCPNCFGYGKVFSIDLILSKILKEAKRIRNHTNVECAIIEVNNLIYKELVESIDNIKEIEKYYNLKILLKSIEDIPYNNIRISNLGSEKELKKIVHIVDN